MVTSLMRSVMLQSGNPMITRDLILLVFLTGYAAVSAADVAECTISIENVNSGTTYDIYQNFSFSLNPDVAHRKHFSLPGYEYICTLAFFDLNIGTMISCSLDDTGHHFIQSDRTGIKNDNTRNNLTFRFGSAFFRLGVKV